MRHNRWLAVTAALAMVGSLTQCRRNVTAPGTFARTHSVTTTATVPATPTAPVTLVTNDAESQVQVTLDVATLQQIVLAAGGGVTIKMTDIAPKDYGTLPAAEAAQLGKPGSLADLVFDITPTSGAAVSLSVEAQATIRNVLQNAAAGGTVTFKVKNNTGKRCTPGKVDLLEIFGASSNLLTSNLFIDDATPLQNITGDTQDVILSVKHFIFCFECPRVTPSGGS